MAANLRWSGRRAAAALAGLAGLSLAACAPQALSADAPMAARPAMWTLSDADTTIYLFGTFHLLPAGHEWRTPLLDQALASADELVLEVVAPDDPMAAAMAMAKLGVTPGLPPLAERVPEDKRAALAAMIAESGIPATALDKLETWAAAFALLGVEFKRLGLSPEAGVETGLTARHKLSGKPISGLETIAEQLGFFDTLSEESQRLFLAGMLEDTAEMRVELAAMLEAWTGGDVAAMDRIFNADVSMSAELRDRLLRRRNANWAVWLERRLERPGIVMVAVGAGHLAGADSVRAMLEARGLKARRVQ